MAPESNPISTGSDVEVWNRPLGRFGGRFHVAETGPAGIRVRPVSEQTSLPGTFTVEEVRPLPGQPETRD